MSIFKSRDRWYCRVGYNEEFDCNNVCIANIDNAKDELEKIIVGSFQGILRIYKPQGSAATANQDLLLEYQTDSPILDLKCGMLVGEGDVYLAILHPRSISVCCVSVDTATSDTGTYYSISQIYSHKLQRTACNMCVGPFGFSKGKEFICVQSMDGMLAFYEQDSFAFARFLPDFLIPGPICYLPANDIFLTSSSSNFIEAYRYQTLAVSTESEKKDNVKTGAGKRLRVDWKSNIGDVVLDIRFFSFSDGNTSIFVLGEHNIFCLKENGSIRFMKKFDFNPSCFVPYDSRSEGMINLLLSNFSGTCFVYQDTTLLWSSSFEKVPIFIDVLTQGALKGHIVTLDDEGFLAVSYLGTDPALNATHNTSLTGREPNYTESDAELARLYQIIRESTTPLQHAPSVSENQADFSLFAEPIDGLDSIPICDPDNNDIKYPTCTVKVNVRCLSKVSLDKVTLIVRPRPPLQSTEKSVVLTNVGSGPTSTATFSIFNTSTSVVSDLEVSVVAHYNNSRGLPRSVNNDVSLPLQLGFKPCTPEKSAENKITIDTNKGIVNLVDVFDGLKCEAAGGMANCVALQSYSGEIVTILAAKNSQKYRLQTNSFPLLYAALKYFILRLRRYFESKGDNKLTVTFPGPIPLQEYFDVIDEHWELRQTQQRYRNLLKDRSQQFRAIQLRLLARYKDKTPAPLQNLDTLLDSTYQQILAIGDADIQNTKTLSEVDQKLGVCTRLMLELIRLWCTPRLDDKQFRILQACLTPLLDSSDDVGWEEVVDAGVTLLLRTCLAKNAKEQGVGVVSQLKAPSDMSKLKKHIALMFERLSKGGTLQLPDNAK